MKKNKPNYLLFEDLRRRPALKPSFDACAASVLDGGARVEQTRAPAEYSPNPCFRVHGHEILVEAVLEYYLSQLSGTSFDYEKARAFTEALRRTAGWERIYYTLQRWVERTLRDPYFYDENYGEDRWNQKWTLKPDEKHGFITEDFFRFACYIAVCFTRYGESWDNINTNKIFDYVTRLGSDLPARLKEQGSGELPKEVTDYEDEEVSCKANDVSAVIRIVVRCETEENYRKALRFLTELLSQEFPRSYSIEFESPEENYLPIKGLPRKGVHRLFANAVRYSGLHGDVERYARLAMREFEWYTDLENEDCAMPGTFAVFALGLRGKKYVSLICDYLELCDDEHSGIQGNFVAAYIGKYGFSEVGMKVFLAGAASMQELLPNECYGAVVADEDALRRLLAAKDGLQEYHWRAALYALWGDDAVYEKGARTIEKAPPHLKPLYEAIFERERVKL
ncbi:MAG: DUF6138 family protein [Synergistaceae bacterium]|jgi:hypothetical protein|nr:DUF6138 family protein [Synergistaceae bacterium]